MVTKLSMKFVESSALWWWGFQSTFVPWNVYFPKMSTLGSGNWCSIFFLGRGQINRQPTSPTHHPCIYPIQVCSQPIRSLLLLASLVLGPASCPDWLAGEARRHKEKLYLPSPSILRKTALPHVQRWTVPAILMPRVCLWVWWCQEQYIHKATSMVRGWSGGERAKLGLTKQQ